MILDAKQLNAVVQELLEDEESEAGDFTITTRTSSMRTGGPGPTHLLFLLWVSEDEFEAEILVDSALPIHTVVRYVLSMENYWLEQLAEHGTGCLEVEV